MIRCFILLISSLSITLNAYATVSFLQGTCSSGKSTLIKELSKKDPELLIIDEDTLVQKNYPKAIAKRFPIEYQYIVQAIDEPNIYASLRWEEIVFSSGVSAQVKIRAQEALNFIKAELDKEENLQWKLEVSQSITDEILKNVGEAIRNERNILIDAWYVKPKHIIAISPSVVIQKILLYCPLEIAYQRLLKRNQEAESQGLLQEKRSIGQLFGSYMMLYELSSSPQHPLELFDKLKFDTLLDQILPSLPIENSPKPIFTFKEISQKKLMEMVNNWLLPLNGEQPEELFITPKESYDRILK